MWFHWMFNKTHFGWPGITIQNTLSDLDSINYVLLRLETNHRMLYRQKKIWCCLVVHMFYLISIMKVDGTSGWEHGKWKTNCVFYKLNVLSRLYLKWIKGLKTRYCLVVSVLKFIFFIKLTSPLNIESEKLCCWEAMGNS